MTHFRLIAILSLLLASLVLPSRSLAAEVASPTLVGDPDIAQRALDLLDAYHRLDRVALEPRLAADFEFTDEGYHQRQLDGEGFLAMVASNGEGLEERSIQVDWVGVMPPQAATPDAPTRVVMRGTWRATDSESGKSKQLVFDIALRLSDGSAEAQLVSWNEYFGRGWLARPAHGNAHFQTPHFNIRYLTAEFDDPTVKRLAALLEKHYDQTSAFLGREFDSGYRLLIDVASCHGSPYASAPGPDAFILVSVKSAKHDYGFSLAHELTHNLIGLSHLSTLDREKYRSGNRLLDEGFGVYVEEKLVPDGGVFPNFGQEIHQAYLDLSKRLDIVRPPVLEAEGLRQQGRDATRLAYLQQASFVKWLIDVAPGPEAADGLSRFMNFFSRDVASAEALYGRDMAHLEDEWLQYLQGLETPTAKQDS